MAIRAAAIGTRDKKTVLLLAADYAGGAQYQPSQSARNDVTITVAAPEGAEAFEISPGRFRGPGAQARRRRDADHPARVRHHGA